MFLEIKPLLIWLNTHPQWAGIATFVITFIESLAILGLIIPGTAVMVAIGSLIGTGYIPLVGTALWAIGGAILGDLLSFFLGFHFHGRVRTIWPLRSFPTVLKKGEDFFQKHGGKSIFLGRFAGPIRTVLPLIAGMMPMSPARFLLADIPSAIIWAPLFLLPGILLGTASQALAPDTAMQFIIIVILALVVMWGISWLLKLIYVWLSNAHYDLLATSWQAIQQNPRWQWLHKVLVDPMQPPSNHVQLNRLVLLLFFGGLFFMLAFNASHQGVFIAFNESVYHFMRSLRTIGAERFFVAVTLFSAQVLSGMWVAVLVWLAICKRWRAAIHWLALGVLIIAATEFFKHLIHSPRPIGLVKTPSGWSFPSGHSTTSLAFFGFFAVLLARNWSTQKQWLAYSVAALLAGLIMLSRLYLMAHWLTDIIGSILLALSCILIVSISYHRKATRSIPLGSTLLIAVLALAVSWGWTYHKHYKRSVIDYSVAWEQHVLSEKNWWAQSDLKPLYRSNRFGKPLQVLNVQWEGPLDQIEKSLKQQGWYKLTKSSLVLAINSLTDKGYKHQPYFLDQIYDDRKAVIEMAKILQFSQTPTLVVLRLWDSHLILDDGNPLWVGTISYRKPWQLHFLKRKGNTNLTNFPPITDVLAKDLKDFQWKKISYTNVRVPKKEVDINWDGYVLLIRNTQGLSHGEN